MRRAGRTGIDTVLPWLAVITSVAWLGCADNGSVFPGGLSKAAQGALPQIASAINSRAAASARRAVGDPVIDQYFTALFTFQCHMPGLADDCPAGVTKDDSNRYSIGTLIGLIYHAEMEMNNVFLKSYTDCDVGEGGRPISVSDASFVSSDGGDGAKFVIDYYDRLSCVGHNDTGDEVVYFTYGTAANEWVMVYARRNTAKESNLLQVYLSDDATAVHRILAFNAVTISAADGYKARSILLVNLQTRRFLVKSYGGGGAASDSYVIAAGKGGISPDGAYADGSYFAKSPMTPTGVCVDNATRTEADVASCTAESVSWTGNADVAAYLELTGKEQADLDGFLAFFADGPTASTLSPEAVPGSLDDVIHIPDVIE